MQDQKPTSISEKLRPLLASVRARLRALLLNGLSAPVALSRVFSELMDDVELTERRQVIAQLSPIAREAWFEVSDPNETVPRTAVTVAEFRAYMMFLSRFEGPKVIRIIDMRCFGGLSKMEISAELAMPVAYIRRTLYEVKAALRVRL